MSEFKVGSKVTCIEANEYFTVGQEYKIKNFDGRIISLTDDEGEQNDWHIGEFEECFKVVPSKNQRITALENEVAELKVIVHQLRKPSTDVKEALDVADWLRGEVEGVIQFEGRNYRKVDREAREGDVVILNERGTEFFFTNKPYIVKDNRIRDEQTNTNGAIYDHGRMPDNVDVYELIVEGKQEGYYPWIAPTKTANEQRAEIIEKAKVFIDSCKTTVRGIAENGSNIGRSNTWNDVYSPVSKSGKSTACYAEFIAVEKKRKVVALLKGVDSNKVYAVGETVCDPSDVFNEHIGRAIALGRALGLDVSEFEQAVQPTELAIGMKVELLKQLTHPNNSPGSIKIISNPGYYPEGGDTCAINSVVAENSKIINDTNAQYGGVE